MAQRVLQEAALSNEEREERYEKFDAPCKKLQEYCNEIIVTRPAIMTAIRKQNNKFTFACIGAATAILGIIVSLVVAWFKS